VFEDSGTPQNTGNNNNNNNQDDIYGAVITAKCHCKRYQLTSLI